MPYFIKELFYTLQGEGRNSGRAAVFCRFTGCNLWSGRTEDRGRGAGGCSAWCDTDFVGTNGTGGGRYDAPKLASAIEHTWTVESTSRRLVVFTGGEPLLQLDQPLLEAIHTLGFEAAIETNGTLPPPPGVDWITVSPKAGAPLKLTTGNELKLVFPQPGAEPELFESLNFDHFFLQPMDGPDLRENTWKASQYCLSHPRWRLSLQLHKVVGLR